MHIAFWKLLHARTSFFGKGVDIFKLLKLFIVATFVGMVQDSERPVNTLDISRGYIACEESLGKDEGQWIHFFF